MTSLTTITTISSFGRVAAQPDHPGVQSDRLRAAAASPRLRRVGSIAAVLALLAAAVLPVHTASAAQSVGPAAQASVKDTVLAQREKPVCTWYSCR